MFFEGHFQNAYVTRNLDRAIEMLKSRYQLSEIASFAPEMVVKTPLGEGTAALRVALVWIGSYQMEIIEPVSGPVDFYRD